MVVLGRFIFGFGGVADSDTKHKMRTVDIGGQYREPSHRSIQGASLPFLTLLFYIGPDFEWFVSQHGHALIFIIVAYSWLVVHFDIITYYIPLPFIA